MKNHPLYLFLKKPMVAGLLTLSILTCIMLTLVYQRYLINENEEKKIVRARADLIEQKIVGLVMHSYAATKTLAYIVERDGIPNDFDKIAIELLERNQYFDVVELVDAKGVITHVYPIKDNEVIGFNILKSVTASSGAITTIKRGAFFVAGPINLKQGGVGFVSRTPIFVNGQFAGFSAVVTKLSTFFNDLKIDYNPNGQFAYQLARVNAETGEEEYFLKNNINASNSISFPIDMDNGEWRLYVSPLHKNINSAYFLAIFAFLLTMLVSWTVWFFAGQSERLSKYVNEKLTEQEAELKLIYETTSKQIKKSEANLKKAQNIAKLGSWELNLETNHLSWSDEMYRIFEKNRKTFELSYVNFIESIHPQDRNKLLNAHKKSSKEARSYHIQYRILTKDNNLKYVEDQGETSYDVNKKPIRSFGIIQDITDRIRTEEILTNSVLLYRSLASNAPVAIFNANKAGECTYVNEEWMKYSGMNFTEAMGYGWHKALHEDDKERVMKDWQETVLKGGEFKTELRFRDKQGKITHLEVKATELYDVNNEMYGYIGMAVDITERIKNEKELLNYKNNLEKLVESRTDELYRGKEALLNLLEDLNIQSLELEKEKVKAQSADLTKSAFLATMSHELRTPMNSIIGFTGILLKEFAGPLNEEQKKQLSMVKKSGEHLLRLINDVLDISKIEAGKLKVSIYPFDYLTTVNKTIDFLTPQAVKKGLKLKATIPQQPITLTSDERRVEQVLLNLISNAIKFSNQGVITVNVEVVEDLLVTDIIDQGIGIDAEGLNKLFTPFIQLESGLNRSHEGTGLGLAICKNLIEKLGGTIGVKSKLGKGSVFTFKLPLTHIINN